MGKIRAAVLGSDEEKELRERRKREREEKKKREAAEGKVHVAGMKGGERMKAVGPSSEEEIEKMAKLAKSVEEHAQEEGKPEKKSKKKSAPKVKSKRYQEAVAKLEHGKLYPISEAISLLGKVNLTKFDATVEVHINTIEKGLRGTVSLPHGTGKKVRVAIADPKTVDAIVSEVEKGVFNFDALVAHPSVMAKLAKVARFLGPKGLMPNPKAGTISPKPEDVANKLAAGEITWKTETDFPIVHQVIGKMSFGDKKLLENFRTLVGSFPEGKIKSITLKSTMSPGIKVKPE